MKRLSSIGIALIVTLGCATATSAASDTAIRRWVEQVLLGTEFGGDGKISARWVKTPTLSVFGGTAEQVALVNRTVRHINETLASTPISKIDVIGRDNEKANIRVYLAPTDKFTSIAARHGFKYVPGNLGYVYVFWNGRRQIQRAFVMLTTDARHQSYLPHLALEEITQSLGLMNDSPEFADSIFYAKGGDDGQVVKLSALDKALIVFFYKHIRPGARAADVRRAFDAHWKK
jgi:hypothetical protein